VVVGYAGQGGSSHYEGARQRHFQGRLGHQEAQKEGLHHDLLEDLQDCVWHQEDAMLLVDGLGWSQCCSDEVEPGRTAPFAVYLFPASLCTRDHAVPILLVAAMRAAWLAHPCVRALDRKRRAREVDCSLQQILLRRFW
jgi:hypothetical protein